MKYLYILLLSAQIEGYYTIKLDRDHRYTCFEQADIWIENNATHTWEAVSYTHLTLPTNREV